MSQTWCVHLSSHLSFPCVFVIDRAYLPCEQLPQSPAYYRYQQQCLPCVLYYVCSVCLLSGRTVCVCMCVCSRSAQLLSLLFSLKSCSVAEQKATSRSPLLRVGIGVYLYLGVQAVVAEAATALFSLTALQFAVTSCSFT